MKDGFNFKIPAKMVLFLLTLLFAVLIALFFPEQCDRRAQQWNQRSSPAYAEGVESAGHTGLY